MRCMRVYVLRTHIGVERCKQDVWESTTNQLFFGVFGKRGIEMQSLMFCSALLSSSMTRSPYDSMRGAIIMPPAPLTVNGSGAPRRILWGVTGDMCCRDAAKECDIVGI